MKINITIDMAKIGYDPYNKDMEQYLADVLDDLKTAETQVLAAYEKAKEKYRSQHNG